RPPAVQGRAGLRLGVGRLGGGLSRARARLYKGLLVSVEPSPRSAASGRTVEHGSTLQGPTGRHIGEQIGGFRAPAGSVPTL
ncbi:hypothetical protein RA267_28195, partial [Pseudomonas syringae pv. tagetis]|uniref:hypothetical protein n=1 Tax=Pseudomonas syringae group genomosp. 7 TaxID=251699 RepID=UPI00376FDB45